MDGPGIIPVLLPLHILAGSLGLVSGYIALLASKGASLHRRSGLLFVCVMLTMAVTGSPISAVEGAAPAINIPAALLTSYLVVTSLTTVRPIAGGARWLDVAAMMTGVAIGLGCVGAAVVSIGKGGAAAGMAYPLVIFGGVAFAAAEGDRRMMRDAGNARVDPALTFSPKEQTS
jgi:uncharacterized membrane protein